MLEVSQALADAKAFVDKFPGAQIEFYKIVLRDVNGVGQVFATEWFAGQSDAAVRNAVIAAASKGCKEDAPAGEAPAASSGKKRNARTAQAAASTSTAASAQPATETDLFGSASEATTPAKASTAQSGQTATQSASPSDEDDLFGEKTAPAADKPKATIEQLRKALTECQTKHGHKDHALGVLKKHTRDGNPTISTLDEAKYQDVIDACAKYVPAK